MIYRTPFTDHTLRLIQLNWVVIAYNFNIVIWESEYRCIFAFHFTTTLPYCYIPCISFISALAKYQS
jgi:hypothetical protein